MARSPAAGWPLVTEDTAEGTRVTFAGRDIALDESNTERAAEQLFRLVEEAGRCRLLLDFANVSYLTSSTLGMLLLLHKKLQAVGGTLALCHLRPQIAEIFAITNLNRLFDIRADGTPPPA